MNIPVRFSINRLKLKLTFVVESVVIRVENGYLCRLCDKVIKHNNIKRHIKDKHSADQQAYVCKYCFKSYKSKNSMETHVSVYHRNEKEADMNYL